MGGMNPHIYYRLKASEQGLPFNQDSEIVKQMLAEILRLQDMMLKVLEKEQNDLLEIHQMKASLLENDKRISICEHQIADKRYQYLKQYY